MNIYCLPWTHFKCNLPLIYKLKKLDVQEDEPQISKEERLKKAQTVSSNRILTAEEFEQIQKRQALKEVEGRHGKRKREGGQEEEGGG